jgi:hypothetical protein
MVALVVVALVVMVMGGAGAQCLRSTPYKGKLPNSPITTYLCQVEHFRATQYANENFCA